MKTDVIKIEILEDGTIKTTTDPISDANHQSADEFIKAMGRLAGGTTVIEHRHGKHGHMHTHTHDDEHTHEH